MPYKVFYLAWHKHPITSKCCNIIQLHVNIELVHGQAVVSPDWLLPCTDSNVALYGSLYITNFYSII